MDEGVPKTFTERWVDPVLLLLLCAVATITGYLLFAVRPDPRADVSREVLGWVETRAVLWRRPRHSTRWLMLRDDEPVRDRDLVVVPHGAEAMISLSGEQTRLPGGAILLFYRDDSAAQGRFRRIGSVSQPGTVTAMPAAGASPPPVVAVVAAPPRVATPPPAAVAPVEAQPGSGETAVDTLAARWKRLTERRRIRPTPTLRRLSAIPPVKDLEDLEDYALVPRPVTGSPRIGARILLTWSPVPLAGVSYTVEVSRGAGFKKSTPLVSSGEPLVSYRIKVSGRHHWRITAHQGARRVTSDPATFEVKGARIVPAPVPPKVAETPPAEAPPRLAVETPPDLVPPPAAVPPSDPAPPPRKAAIRRRAAAVPPPVQSSAAEGSGTEGGDLDGFTIEIATDSEFNEIVSSALSTEAKCPRSGLPAGSYHCRITPIQGEAGPRVSRFSVR